jgi:tRNA(Ile)-lysidine synthase
MNSVEKLEAALAQAWPQASWTDTHVVAAVSGGADSCALLAALVRLKSSGSGEIVAAHFHHGLRGASADADAAFVEQLGKNLGVKVIIGRREMESIPSQRGDGIEAAARAARYEFLLQTANDNGARYVATAHTADDQVETILHRIVRGTGIAGLAGIRRTRPLGDTVTLVRPLLDIKRSEVIDYLSARALAHRTDETNLELAFTRNRIRHELLPQLRKDFNPEVDAALLRLAQLAGENQRVIDGLVDELVLRAALRAGDEVRVSAAAVKDVSGYLVRELFVRLWRRSEWPEQAMGFAEWNALVDLLTTETNTAAQQRIFPGNIRATKKGEQLTLTRLG